MGVIQTIKGYELQEELKGGGMGQIHRAYQSSVGREVIIKEIRPEYANKPDFIRLFDKEAQMIARLEHPHIVPLYDYWREPDGAYLIMRYLRGGSLKESLLQGAFDIFTTNKVMMQICSALHTAHRAGIIHRDIKPANILFDEDGNAYLADFGIAKDYSVPVDGTQSDVIKGTLLYLAPEQARSEPITPRTDIYSLGVVLYEMLAGEHPFPNLSGVEVMYKHLNEPLPLLTNLDATVQDAVNQVIQTATAKNPIDRYDNIMAFAKTFTEAAHLQVPDSTESMIEALTPREIEILRILVENKRITNKEIAQQLVLAMPTVKWYIRQLLKKLNARNRVQLIVIAQKLELFTQGYAVEFAGTQTVIGYIEVDNPYKGLRAFQSADSQDFFGRDKITRKILARLQQKDPYQRFLAIVGPSGSGKSSLVKAGVIPAIWRGEIPNSDKWFVVDMLPGTRPLDELEVALKKVAADKTSDIREQLERDANGLLRVASLILPDDGAELLIVIDQFEEIFTLLENEDERQHFLDLICAAVTDKRSRVRVIITLRADFFDRPLRYPNFGEMMRERVETVLPLTAEELEQAIVNPVKRYGFKFEEGLVAAIIGDINYQPGALPLLQYALSELFEQHDGNKLTHTAYQEIGRAVGALAKRADEIFHELSPEQQALVHQMFMRLVTLGEGTEDTRRRTNRAELLNLSDNPELMDEVIDLYANYRLLALDHDPSSRVPTVEVAHEAILREWERLRTWLNDSREDIKSQRMLSATAIDWQQNNQDQSYLLHGTRLEQIEGWATDTKLALTPHERNFLAICIDQRNQQYAVERERQQREVGLKQRAHRVLQLLVVVSLVAAVIGIGLSVFAFDREQRAQDARATSDANAIHAEREAAVNHSLVLANEALRRYDVGKPDLSLALALEAVNIEDPPAEAVRILSTVTLGMGTRAILRPQGNKVTALAFNSDSTLAISGGCATLVEETCTKGELIVWNIETAQKLRHLDSQAGWVTALAFDPLRPAYALSASEDGTLALWDVITGELNRHFEGHSDRVNSVAFSADGATVLSGSDDQTVILWEVATGQIIRRFDGHIGGVTAVAFSPDGQFVAASGDSDDATIFLWQIDTGNIVHRLEGPTARILSMNFRVDDRDQTLVFAYSYDNTYREWNVETGALLRTISVSDAAGGLTLSPDGRSGLANEGNIGALVNISSWTNIAMNFTPSLRIVTSNAISPDGKLALIGSEVGEVILVNLPISQEAHRFHDATGGLSTVDSSPNGHSLLTGSAGTGTVILWDVQTGQEVRRLEGQLLNVASAAFSPDGRQALIGFNDAFGASTAGQVVLWDIETGEVIHEWTDFDFYPRSVAISPDGHTALVGTLQWGAAWGEELGAGELILLDLVTGQQIRRFETTTQILDISFSPDGRRAVTVGGPYGAVTLWDITTGQPIRYFDHVSATVLFTPDSRYFLTGSSGGFIFLVDVETGANIRSFTGQASVFWSIDISPDQQYLLGGGDGGLLVVWNYETGEEIQHFQGHSSGTATWNVAFSPDSQTFYSSSLLDEQGDVIQWRIANWPLDDLLAWVQENRYTRDFTCEERVQYRIEPYCD